MHSYATRQQVIADMKMAGISLRTQQNYLGVIDRFFGKHWLTPEQVTEKMVNDYLNAQIERGICHGTLKPIRFALQFLFQNTLRRDWGLFKKESPRPDAIACPAR